jgi:hypothetical protein
VQVFYKFARDDKKIYGSDLLAQKAATLEMKALNAIIDANITSLHVALSSLIRINGHAIYATCQLPIDGRKSLIYGSSNAGAKIKSAPSDSALQELLRKLADKLHLKEHTVTDGGNQNHKLLFPFDMEVHLGSDGRLYLLDLARLMPPTPPMGEMRNSYLYHHFRFEFLSQYCGQDGLPLALSSDVYSHFGKCQSHISQMSMCVCVSV